MQAKGKALKVFSRHLACHPAVYIGEGRPTQEGRRFPARKGTIGRKAEGFILDAKHGRTGCARGPYLPALKGQVSRAD